jgi:hypothetical protein
MTFPKQRITIALAEYLLLKPGLDVLANGLAGAKLESFPHRHPFDRIDFVASDVYRNKAYDDQMAARVVSVRNKLWDLSQSRKICLDPFELAAAAFALRLWKAHEPSSTTEAVPAGVKLLEAKIERYRRRAKSAAVKLVGKSVYEGSAQRWRGFQAWSRYNLLYFKLPNRGKPRQANFWREQREQLTVAIKAALEKGFFEIPSDEEIAKIVTLATRSLRRGRHPVTLRELLQAPQDHTDFLVGFVEKRFELKPLPNAPVPPWKAASDRADIFRACRERRAQTAPIPSSVNPHESAAGEEARNATTPLKAVTSNGYTHKGKAITAEVACDAMAEWLYRTVTVKFDLTREVCEQAKFLIQHGAVDGYRGTTTATSFDGLIEELRPADVDTDLPSFINTHAEWLLKVLLALRQKPIWIYQALGSAWVRAKQLEEKARYDEWVATRANGSQRASIRV